MKPIRTLSLFLSAFLCLGLLKPTTISLADGGHYTKPNMDILAFGDDVPDYYQKHLSEKIRDINALEEKLRGGQEMDDLIRFLWFTDYHFDPNEYTNDTTHGHCNTKNSPALMREILKYTGINRIIFGGDIATSYSCYRSQKYLLDCLSDYKKTFSFAENILYSVNGNHEYFTQDSPPSYTQLSMILRDPIIRNAYSVDSYGDYTVLDEADKLCWIMINSHDDVYHYRPDLIKDEQIDYLFNQLLEVPDGYSIIIVTHALLRYDGMENGIEKWTPFPSAEKIFDGLADFVDGDVHFFDSETYDFTQVNADIICCLAGHAHLDTEYILPCKIPVILTTCDTVRKRYKEYDRDTGIMVKATDFIGTYREQAFDVVTVDRNNHKLYLIRIGDEGIDCVGNHKEKGERSLYYPSLIKDNF